jgi:uncharacterized alpha-E superfamily protein
MIIAGLPIEDEQMSKTDLHHQLEQLRSEIERVARDDEQARKRMDDLLGEVERKIDESSEEEIDDNLMENLRETITQFETDHPRATAILNDIMVTLSNMGI